MMRITGALIAAFGILATSEVASDSLSGGIPVGRNANDADRGYRLPLTVTTPLKFRNVPLDPLIDFQTLIEKAELSGRLDPNSIEVVDLLTGRRVPHALGADFHHGDKGRLEFLIEKPTHTRYEIRFRTLATRPPLVPRDFVPPVGVGDLLRYNAGEPRPITLFYSMGLHDLTGDGRLDLVGTWNYAYRPGEPYSGIVCYPRAGDRSRYDFGDLTRVRYVEKAGAGDFQHFRHTYMSADFADFNRDGLADLVYAKGGVQAVEIYLNSGRRDAGGMPIFHPGGTVHSGGGLACRAVDLNDDGAVDLVVDGRYVRNGNPQGWPFTATDPVALNAGRSPCFLDVDRDGRLDAVCLRGGPATQPDFYRVAWRKNTGVDPPTFGEERLLEDVNPAHVSFVSSFREGDAVGLIVQHNVFQEVSFYELTNRPGAAPRFERRGRAESTSAVMSLSDQAWPCLCDWDGDGDQDLLIGGGYGWPRIVINEGTADRPAFAEPKPILANGKPIRLVRNQLLGEPHNGHDMGYPYPQFVDWDNDGLPDLVCPNETNRIYWYKNEGTRRKPRFSDRRQILCDGYPDNPTLRKLSATRANDKNSTNGVYPYEKERPFLWRTGAAFADWNGDGLTDFITHDGHTRQATLFLQYRDRAGRLRLRKARAVKLRDGRPINDAIVNRSAHWTESFRAVDWNGDGLLDLIYSVAGAHHGTLEGGSIYLLKNVGTKRDPIFAPPQTMRCFGEPIRITNHGPSAWPGDFDGDGKPDLITCVEWSVYPFYVHAALMMKRRPEYELGRVQRVTESK